MSSVNQIHVRMQPIRMNGSVSVGVCVETVDENDDRPGLRGRVNHLLDCDCIKLANFIILVFFVSCFVPLTCY